MHPLAPGDTIRLGRSEWVVEAAHAPARPAAAIAHLAVTSGRAEPSTVALDVEADVTIGRGDDNDRLRNQEDSFPKIKEKRLLERL